MKTFKMFYRAYQFAKISLSCSRRNIFIIIMLIDWCRLLISLSELFVKLDHIILFIKGIGFLFVQKKSDKQAMSFLQIQ